MSQRPYLSESSKRTSPLRSAPSYQTSFSPHFRLDFSAYEERLLEANTRYMRTGVLISIFGGSQITLHLANVCERTLSSVLLSCRVPLIFPSTDHKLQRSKLE
jgi:hypothetical protein